METTSFLTIAYVTALLKSLVEHGLVRDRIADLVGGVAVSALPPDQLGAGPDEQARINLFLSHITPNTRVRSFDPDGPSDAPAPSVPLALDLHYVITAYSTKELQVETLLGYVGALFRERPGLMYSNGNWQVAREDLSAPKLIDTPAVPGASPLLPGLIHSIGIRPQIPSADEHSKLWSALQIKYRPSLSYKVELQPERTERPARMALRTLEGAR